MEFIPSLTIHYAYGLHLYKIIPPKGYYQVAIADLYYMDYYIIMMPNSHDN